MKLRKFKLKFEIEEIKRVNLKVEMWSWSVKLKLEDKKFSGWKDLKLNIFEVNAFEDKEIWRQGKMKLKFEGEV